MTVDVDTNKISFQDLNIEDLAYKKGLLVPLHHVPTQNAGDYKGALVDVGGEDNKEKLVDVAEYGIKSIPYYRTQAYQNPTYKKNIPGAPDVNYARLGTVNQMQDANKILNELGLELVVLDAHRSPVTQNILFEAFKEQYYEKIGCGTARRTTETEAFIKEKRKFFDEQAKEFALEFCSSAENFDAKDSKTWTIHSTGGAVDVCMLDKKSGKVVDMGEQYFDNPKPITHTNHYEKMNSAEMTEQQKGFVAARRVLYNTMTSVGFVNYEYECFHYSYKDLYWACVKGESAKYGYVKSPKDCGLSLVMGALLRNAYDKK